MSGVRTWFFSAHRFSRLACSPGPWDSEPDKVQWIDPATGLDCLIHRNPGGALCGYVGVPPGHPCHGRGYNAVHDMLPGLRVHGGLTFSDSCALEESADGHGICHVPEPGRPADVWWLGFDCAHEGLRGDLVPRGGWCPSGAVYRDLAYVRDQVTSLARQLAAG